MDGGGVGGSRLACDNISHPSPETGQDPPTILDMLDEGNVTDSGKTGGQSHYHK